MPDENVVNKDFLKQVLAGKKQLLKKAQVQFIQVPHYDELSVKRFYPGLKKDPKFLAYLPDKYPKDKGPPRTYFMNVLNTLYPEFLQECMHHANEQRMAAFGEGQQKESIAITQYWQEELKAMPYLSRKYLLPTDPVFFHIHGACNFVFLQRNLVKRSTCSRPRASRSKEARRRRRSRCSAPSRTTCSRRHRPSTALRASRRPPRSWPRPRPRKRSKRKETK